MMVLSARNCFQGFGEQAQFRRLREYLRDFPDTVLATEDYEEAARASNECRKAGIAGGAS